MSDTPARVRIWDWTVRVFHWSFVALFGLMWWTAEEGHMDWHTRIGLVALGVLVFRLYWGIAGAQTARFSALVSGPRTILDYLRTGLKRPYKPSMGHNPMGALSVIALLLAMATVIGSGLFTVDVNGFAEGPLARWLDFKTARAVADFHEQAFQVLQVLVILHLVAIAFYAVVLKANLIGPMITGWRRDDETAADDSPMVAAPWGRVLTGLVLSAGSVAILVWA